MNPGRKNPVAGPEDGYGVGNLGFAQVLSSRKALYTGVTAGYTPPSY